MQPDAAPWSRRTTLTVSPSLHQHHLPVFALSQLLGFHADGVDQRSKVFPSKKDAELDLSWLHFFLYPIWLQKGERAGHLCNLMRRCDEHLALADMAASVRLGFARQHFELVTADAVYSLSSGDRISLAVGQRLDLRLERLADATEVGLRLRLALYVEQLLRQSGFAGGVQQDAAECLMHLFFGIDQGQMQSRVCGANAAASVESLILCEFGRGSGGCERGRPCVYCLFTTDFANW